VLRYVGVHLGTNLEIRGDEVRVWGMPSVETHKGDFQLTFIKKELDPKLNQIVDKPNLQAGTASPSSGELDGSLSRAKAPGWKS
jgi:hypothetical protein